jgi:hypothetical protein
MVTSQLYNRLSLLLYVLTYLLDLYDAGSIASTTFSTLAFLPSTHINALSVYFRALAPTSNPPYTNFHTTLLSIQSTLIALLTSLSRPTSLISSITQSTKSLSRNYNSLSRSTRWPLGLLDDTRLRIDREKEEKVRKGEEEREELGKELRYTQQVVASELAGWQEWRAREARRAVRDLVRGMVVRERARLEGMERALRRLRVEEPAAAVTPVVVHVAPLISREADVGFQLSGGE